jgi:quinoprotein glucose dehydrogenase
MVGGTQYVAIAAGGSGKNATKSGDAIIAFALPEAGSVPQRSKGWIDLFDGSTLNGWVHLNGAHTYTVEDGAIVGRTVESSAAINSFLCTLQEFDDFELELETMIDRVTNSGIQIRTAVRPMQGSGKGNEYVPGRVFGPQVEIRRSYKGLPGTGLLYGEALGTGWLSSKEKIAEGHPHFINEGWNTLRIVAEGARIRTWVNDQPVEDLINEEVYKTHPKGFIGLQIHGLSEREVDMPANRGFGLSVHEPLVIKWRKIRIRAL